MPASGVNPPAVAARLYFYTRSIVTGKRK